MAEPGIRILIVDDDRTFAEVVAEALSDEGYETVVETDPVTAVDRASDGRFAAAVVDLVMPRLGGLEVAERLRADQPDTQVVILTGQGDKRTAIGGIQRGVYDYLEKGELDFGRLLRSVGQAVEKSRLARENRALVERLRQANGLQRALAALGDGLRQARREDRLLADLVTAAKELTRAAAGRLVLLARGGEDELVVSSWAGDGTPPVGSRLAAGHGIAASVAASDQSLVLQSAAADARYAPSVDALPTDAPGFVCVPLRHGAVLGALSVGGREQGFGIAQRDALAALAQQAAVALDNARQHERARNFFTHASEMLVSILDRMDRFYPDHARRVAALVDMASRRMGLTETERWRLHFGALLHDIGKLMLGPDLINAPEHTDDQREQMRQHCELGLELLRPVEAWEEILPILYAHHERWDGSGYPRGLAGEEIPLHARIVAVADAFDNMLRDRPWAPRRSPADALAELESCAGTQFDPQVVRFFVAALRDHGDELLDSWQRDESPRSG